MAARTVYPPIKLGQVFGRWTVLSFGEPRVYGRAIQRTWVCVCSCGTTRPVIEISLNSGKSVSCGCFNREMSKLKNTQHGQSSGGLTPEYRAWMQMLDRCRNPGNKRYASYGGRGITVAACWSKSFEVFFKDMGKRPSPKHSLDRINNDGGYSPENCCWSLSHDQMVNRRCTRYVDVDGQRIPLATLAKEYGLPANTLRARLVHLDWPLSAALLTPVRPKCG